MRRDLGPPQLSQFLARRFRTRRSGIRSQEAFFQSRPSHKFTFSISSEDHFRILLRPRLRAR